MINENEIKLGRLKLGHRVVPTKDVAFPDVYNYFIHLYIASTKRKPIIGAIDLAYCGKKNGIKWFCTHSDLDSPYHSRGFGIYLYSIAIDFCLKRRWRVSSSACRSMWARIYQIEYKDKHYWVMGRQK